MEMKTLRLEQSPHVPEPRSEDAEKELLRPLPRIGIRTVAVGLLVILIYAWGLNGTNARPDELIRGIPDILNFLSRLLPPELEIETVELRGLPLVATLSFPFPEVVTAIVETLQMAVIGTTISVFLSIPFGLLAARNVSPHPVVYAATRFALNINRAVPEIVFALIFVSAVGLGPFGGVLALAVGSVGFMGKMYAEAIEAIDPQQVLAVRATGATRLQSFVFGVLPQALPMVASYCLYLFEHNVRAATILGLVGAGGVGFIISKYIALFQFRQLTGAMILIIISVTIIDRFSDYLRKKII